MRGGGNNCKNDKCTLKIVDNKIGDIRLNANNIVSFYYYEDIDTDKEPIKVLMNLGVSEINYLQFGTVVIKSADKTVYKVNYTEPNHEGELENISKGINTPFFLNRIVAESFKLLAIKPDKSFMKNARTLKGFIEMVFPPTKHLIGSPTKNIEAPDFYDNMDRHFNDNIDTESNATTPITTPTITTPPIETELLNILKEEIKKKINLVNLNLDDTNDPNAVKIKEHLNQAGKYIAPFLQYQNIIQKLGLKLENEKVPIDMLESLARIIKVYDNEDLVVAAIKNINIGGKVEIHKRSDFDDFINTFQTLANEKHLQAFKPGKKIPETMGNYFIVVGVKHVKVPGGTYISYPVLLMSNGTYTILNEARLFVDSVSSLCPTPSPIKSDFIEFVQKTCLLPDTRLAHRFRPGSTTSSRFSSMYSIKSNPAIPDATTTEADLKGGRRTKKQRKYRKYRK